MGRGGPTMDRQLDDITEWLVKSLLASSKARLKTKKKQNKTKRHVCVLACQSSNHVTKNVPGFQKNAFSSCRFVRLPGSEGWKLLSQKSEFWRSSVHVCHVHKSQDNYPGKSWWITISTNHILHGAFQCLPGMRLKKCFDQKTRKNGNLRALRFNVFRLYPLCSLPQNREKLKWFAFLQACPLGSRTEVNMFPPLPLLYRQLRRQHNIRAQNTDAERSTQFNSVESPPFYLSSYSTFLSRFMRYRSNLMTQKGGACNFHDTYGRCGEPFPMKTPNDIPVNSKNLSEQPEWIRIFISSFKNANFNFKNAPF